MKTTLADLFRHNSRCPEDAEQDRLDELQALERKGLATWDELGEIRNIQRRQAIREHRRSR